MNYRISLFSLCLGLILSGCAIKHPQTAAEFRKAAPGAAFGSKQSFEVNRSIARVSATFKKMAPQCLHKRVKSVSSGYMYYQVVVTDYNPTVIVGKKHTELDLQQDHIQGVMNVSKKPKGGYYLMVVDATAIAKNKTRIDMYAPSIGYDHVIDAIKGWATGKNIGCPDLTKNS
jgi:hypothetical protein